MKKLSKAQSDMHMLHRLRSERTQITHTGQAPTEEDIARAEGSFRELAKVEVGVLEESAP